jgi:hypothetical protein
MDETTQFTSHKFMSCGFLCDNNYFLLLWESEKEVMEVKTHKQELEIKVSQLKTTKSIVEA